MPEAELQFPRPDGGRLAARRIPGAGPTVVWLGGFASDMTGTKAQALAGWAERAGRAYLRFDYFGHGASSGEFRQGTIGRWREDVLAVIDELTEGPLVLVGSSMGGWLACLAAVARPQRIAGLVLVAPAADFTERLIRPGLSAGQLRAIGQTGAWEPPSGAPPITGALLEEGKAWSILPGPVAIDAPVRVLQGGRDDAVPWTHALELFQALRSEDAAFTLIRDGDHRLSRPQDIQRLVAAVQELSSPA